MSTEYFKLSHTPALDGIRGMAIALVLAAHVPLFAFLRGGWLGVEIFFILSGFLITSLLVKEFDSMGRIGFRAFYQRRIRRLAPALLITVIVVNAYVLLFRSPEEVASTWFDSAVTLAYLGNWGQALFFLRGPYFAHTWSLAIEEQFYIVYPALLALLLRNLSRVSVIAFIASVGFLSWLWRANLIGQDTVMNRIYHGGDTRLDGILAGCVLALAFSTPLYGRVKRYAARHPDAISMAALVAFIVLLVAAFRFDAWQSMTYYAGLPLVALSVCVLIVSFTAAPPSALTRLFEYRGLVYLGRISYALYLWHWIVMWMLRGVTFPSPMPIEIIGVIVGLIAAHLSYRYIEGPILRRKPL